MGGRARVPAKFVGDEDLNNRSDGGFSTDEEEEGDREGIERSDELVDLGANGHLRLRADIALEDGDYAGKKTSRKAALEEEDDDAAEELEERLLAAYSQETSDEDQEQAGKRDLVAGQNDELEALYLEYERLREEEAKEVEILREQDKDSHLKGQAVQHQKALWDRSLEVRISLQKILSGANRLPGKQTKVSFCQENEQIKKAYSSLTESAVRTLDCLLELGTVLIENNSAITESYSSVSNANGKRAATAEVDRDGESLSDRAWENMERFYSRIVPYRDNALDRWQRKTQIYTGAVAKVKLRAFNQSVSQQVAAAMRDSSRLSSRMRLKRDSVHVLGQPVLNAVKDAENTKTDEAVETRSGDAVENDGDPDTFDDSEFYQQLLHEFLASSDPSALGTMNLYFTARRQNKKRKQVDRRASKGRKIRYNVFEPLLNFMAPKPMVLPPMTTQLFSNLFGQRKAAPTAA